MALTKLNFGGSQTALVASNIPALSSTQLPSNSIINTVTEYHTTSTEISTSFTTYVSPSITPTATNSKILVLVTFTVDIIGDSNFNAKVLRSIGGASDSVLNPDIGESFYGAGNLGSANQHGLCYAINTIDSPNTTSAVEYKLQLRERVVILLEFYYLILEIQVLH